MKQFRELFEAAVLGFNELHGVIPQKVRHLIGRFVGLNGHDCNKQPVCGVQAEIRT
jgi:hypothetical protein